MNGTARCTGEYLKSSQAFTFDACNNTLTVKGVRIGSITGLQGLPRVTHERTHILMDCYRNFTTFAFEPQAIEYRAGCRGKTSRKWRYMGSNG